MNDLTYDNLVVTEELRYKAHTTKLRRFDGDYKMPRAIFYDACFCILAPQAKFDNNSAIVEELKNRAFYTNDVPFSELAELCKKSRFYNVKAKRLIAMKKNFPEILRTVRDEKLSSEDKRSWLVHNVNGFGMKAASHFLRNLGEDDMAILDTHVFKFLKCKPPKSRAEYYEMEDRLDSIAKQHDLTICDLDLIIWQHYANVPWDEYVY